MKITELKQLIENACNARAEYDFAKVCYGTNKTADLQELHKKSDILSQKINELAPNLEISLDILIQNIKSHFQSLNVEVKFVYKLLEDNNKDTIDKKAKHKYALLLYIPNIAHSPYTITTLETCDENVMTEQQFVNLLKLVSTPDALKANPYINDYPEMEDIYYYSLLETKQSAIKEKKQSLIQKIIKLTEAKAKLEEEVALLGNQEKNEDICL